MLKSIKYSLLAAVSFAVVANSALADTETLSASYEILSPVVTITETQPMSFGSIIAPTDSSNMFYSLGTVGGAGNGSQVGTAANGQVTIAGSGTAIYAISALTGSCDLPASVVSFPGVSLLTTAGQLIDEGSGTTDVVAKGTLFVAPGAVGVGTCSYTITAEY